MQDVNQQTAGQRWVNRLRGSRWFPVVSLGAALLLIGTAVFTTSLLLRREVRRQIIQRDAEVFHAVAVSQLSAGSADELAVLLQTSRQRGVVGVRMFDPDGTFLYGFPVEVKEAALAANDLKFLRGKEPIGRYHREVALADLFDASLVAENLSAKPERAPLVELLVPLHDDTATPLLGIAQFLIDGENVAEEFHALDHNIWRQGLITFSLSAAILLVVAGGAMVGLARAQQQLVERSARLLQANQELALAAKTSAIGAVTSHLIHGIKNPLAGLQNFWRMQENQATGAAVNDWYDAAASTQRMHDLVSEVVRVLREEQVGSQYELTVNELVEVLQAKLNQSGLGQKCAVRIASKVEGSLGNRDANLVLLILDNLLRNGIEATPESGHVTLRFVAGAGGIECEVRDQGSGIDESLRASLFSPVRSGKPGGSGIGLAISHQLARALGASLSLRESGPSGSCFVLTLPAQAVDGRWLVGSLAQDSKLI